MSRLTSPAKSDGSAGCARWRLLMTEGRTVKPRPKCSGGRSVSSPARPDWKISMSRLMPDHRLISCSRVPIAVDVFSLGADQAIEPRSVGVHGEHVPRPAVLERVENDHDVIFLVERDVPRLRERHDAAWFGVVAADANDDVRRRDEHAHDGPSGGHTSFVWLDRREARDRVDGSPHGFGQRAVQRDVASGACADA